MIFLNKYFKLYYVCDDVSEKNPHLNSKTEKPKYSVKSVCQSVLQLCASNTCSSGLPLLVYKRTISSINSAAVFR